MSEILKEYELKEKKREERDKKARKFIEKYPIMNYGLDYELASDLNEYYRALLLSDEMKSEFYRHGITYLSDELVGLPKIVREYIDDMEEEVRSTMNYFLPFINYQYDIAQSYNIKAPKHPEYITKATLIKFIAQDIKDMNKYYREKLKEVGFKPVTITLILDILNKYGDFYIHKRIEAQR